MISLHLRRGSGFITALVLTAHFEYPNSVAGSPDDGDPRSMDRLKIIAWLVGLQKEVQRLSIYHILLYDYDTVLYILNMIGI